MYKILIGVMGPGETATLQDCQHAYQLGQLIAEAGWVLLTGGRNVGVMDSASRGAKSMDGLTIGILPTATMDGVSAAIDIPILTDLGSARNNINVLSSHVVVACGMGAGTLSEIALALKAGKPVVLLNCDRPTFELLHHLTPGNVHWAETPNAAMDFVRALIAQH